MINLPEYAKSGFITRSSGGTELVGNPWERYENLLRGKEEEEQRTLMQFTVDMCRHCPCGTISN